MQNSFSTRFYIINTSADSLFYMYHKKKKPSGSILPIFISQGAQLMKKERMNIDFGWDVGEGENKQQRHNDYLIPSQ